MSFTRKIGLVLGLLVMIGLSCLFYAVKIEPYRLRVNEYQLNAPASGKQQLKIVQFSDTHIKGDFTAKNLAKVVQKINEQEPDVVVFTGDLYDNYAKYNDDEQVIATLKQLKARLVKLAVWGNHDHGGGAVRAYQQVMEQAGFTVLQNEAYKLLTPKNKTVRFVGADDSLLSQADISAQTNQPADYKVLLSHEPDSVADIGQNYDLILSGHSHGGQIKIPLLPKINQQILASSRLVTRYSAGMYAITPTTKLYVNTGIGTTRISARFGVIPEITVFYCYV